MAPSGRKTLMTASLAAKRAANLAAITGGGPWHEESSWSVYIRSRYLDPNRSIDASTSATEAMSAPTRRWSLTMGSILADDNS